MVKVSKFGLEMMEIQEISIQDNFMKECLMDMEYINGMTGGPIKVFFRSL